MLHARPGTVIYMSDPRPDPFASLWATPFALAAGVFAFWSGVFSSHRLTAAERDDLAHGQLVVPEPLQGKDDRDLFA